MEPLTPTTLRFDLAKGRAPLSQHTLSARSVTIGSGPAAMIRLPEEDAAPLHAVVNINEDGSAWLLDLGAGTTRLGGEAINNAPLRSGDAFQIGSVTVRFCTDEVEEHTEPLVSTPDDDIVTEDPLVFLMRSGMSASDLGDDPSAAPVMEVASIWGDVVMDVKHFARARSRVTIGAAVGHRWRLLGAPIAWVPETFSPLAWMAAPALSEVRREWRDDFYAPDLDRHTLLEQTDGQTVLRFRPGWDGFVDIGEERHALSALVASGQTTRDGEDHLIALPRGSRAVVEIDGVIFVAREVRASRRVVTPIGGQIDYPFAGIMAFMGFAFLMLSTLLLSAPAPAQSEIIQIPDRFAEIFVQELQEPPPVPAAEDKPAATNEDEGEKAKGDEGRPGRKDAKMEVAQGDRVEMDRKQHDRDVAIRSGVLGALSESGDLDGVFSSSALSDGVMGGLGGLIGAKGVQVGTGGLGSRGAGLGNGGRAAGIGGLGTHGRGGGDGTYGNTDGGSKTEGRISSPDPMIAMGALDKALIEQVIKQHMNQIRYCYQRQLTRDPSLSGKVVVRFVIAGDGSVSKAIIKSSSLGSSAAESCITGRFMRFQFPEPKGNGIVIVSYPFMFSAG